MPPALATSFDVLFLRPSTPRHPPPVLPLLPLTPPRPPSVPPLQPPPPPPPPPTFLRFTAYAMLGLILGVPFTAASCFGADAGLLSRALINCAALAFVLLASVARMLGPMGLAAGEAAEEAAAPFNDTANERRLPFLGVRDVLTFERGDDTLSLRSLPPRLLATADVALPLTEAS